MTLVCSDGLFTMAALLRDLCAVRSQNRDDLIIVVFERIIQRRLPTMSVCTPIDVSAVRDEYFRSFPIRIWVAATT